jgi:gamma-glutamylcyclotransferase (GGCT)/AIG2-like uncharacterized protein YtfP
MEFRCPRAVPVKPLLLRGWRLEFFNHATITQHGNSQVPGALWALTPECEAALDAFEGYPYYYSKRTWIQDDLQFFFYVMNDEKSGAPSPGYVNNIREGYTQWGLPKAILDQSLELCST